MRPSHAVRKKDHEPKDHGWCKLDLKIPQKTEYRSQGLYDAALAILQNIQTGEFPWNFAALLPNLEWNSASLTNGTSYSFELSPGLLKVVEFCWIAQVFSKFILQIDSVVNDQQQQALLTTCTKSCSNRLTLGSVVVCQQLCTWKVLIPELHRRPHIFLMRCWLIAANKGKLRWSQLTCYFEKRGPWFHHDV